jgi:predicted site-specific integrase-resolvase
MGLISRIQAAERLGISQETLDDWIRRGLLTLYHPTPGQECVEEEQLFDVADSLGWLQHSAECWGDD